ncbi:MAG: hypothetical protein AAF494_00715 [Pseudomonadota bacterium]
MDYGFTLEGALGGASVRIDRPGSRFMASVSYPLMQPEVARVFVARLIRAKSEGLRIPYPLLRLSQNGSGAPVVDGADQSGSTINLRGFNPGFQFREGGWLSIEDASGQHYLHNVAALTTAASDGRMALPIAPMLRAPFADGASVHVAKPMIEGVIEGESADWTLRVDHLTQLSFTIKEAA